MACGQQGLLPKELLPKGVQVCGWYSSFKLRCKPKAQVVDPWVERDILELLRDTPLIMGMELACDIKLHQLEEGLQRY